MASFPLPPLTIVVNPNGASAAVTGLTRGCVYRVVADAACYLTNKVAATQFGGMYIPPNFPQEFMFGMPDSQGTNLIINAWMTGATARVYFTPIMQVSAG